MPLPAIQLIRNFFQKVGNIIYPRNGGDIGVAQGDRVYFDSDQVAPNDYIGISAGDVVIVEAGSQRMTWSNPNTSHNNFIPGTDNALDLGLAGSRWRNGFFSSWVGIHSGAAWTDFLQPGVLTISQRPSITTLGEEMRLGDGPTIFIPTLPSLATEANITTPINGMMYYNTTLNAGRLFENGGWRNI